MNLRLILPATALCTMAFAIPVMSSTGLFETERVEYYNQRGDTCSQYKLINNGTILEEHREQGNTSAIFYPKPIGSGNVSISYAAYKTSLNGTTTEMDAAKTVWDNLAPAVHPSPTPLPIATPTANTSAVLPAVMTAPQPTPQQSQSSVIVVPNYAGGSRLSFVNHQGFNSGYDSPPAISRRTQYGLGFLGTALAGLPTYFLRTALLGTERYPSQSNFGAIAFALLGAGLYASHREYISKIDPRVKAMCLGTIGGMCLGAGAPLVLKHFQRS